MAINFIFKCSVLFILTSTSFVYANYCHFYLDQSFDSPIVETVLTDDPGFDDWDTEDRPSLPLSDAFYRDDLGQFQDIKFKSALSGDMVSYQVDHILGVSTSTVFVSSDRKAVVKIYDAKNPHADYVIDYRPVLNEVLLTRFFLSHGVTVPKIIDYSESAVLFFMAPEVVVVKEYIPGLTYKFLLEKGLPDGFAPENTIEDVMGEYKVVQKIASGIFQNYYANWIKTQPESKIHFIRPLMGIDNSHENWIYTPTGWVLIDP